VKRKPRLGRGFPFIGLPGSALVGLIALPALLSTLAAFAVLIALLPALARLLVLLALTVLVLLAALLAALLRILILVPVHFTLHGLHAPSTGCRAIRSARAATPQRQARLAGRTRVSGA
jgi:hypothetical protein